MQVKLLALIGLVCAMASCRPPPPAPPVEAAPVDVFHLGDEWFDYRGPQLGLTTDEARARDDRISDSAPPPDNFWDKALARETGLIWTRLCANCHGGRRSVARAVEIAAPPPGWGQSEGFFFTGSRTHSDVFAMIYHGAEVPPGAKPPMPPWKDKLSREQIWALVYWIEHESGQLGADVETP